MKRLMVTVGGLVALVVIVAVARNQDVVDPDLGRRVVAIGMGLILVVISNAFPKLVRPLTAQGSNPARVLAAERFAARTLVLTGIAFVALWALSPIEHLMRISALVGLAGFGLVGVSRLRLMLDGNTRSREAEGADEDPAAKEVAIKRTAIVGLLHGLLWVFAMFLADSIWGDTAAPWMVIAFVVATVARSSRSS
jgi:hypothetical protein